MNWVTVKKEKNFDIFKIISLVFERKGWGKTYTLYSTEFHEIEISMVSYSFVNKTGNFKVVAREKASRTQFEYSLSIYTDRKDYTVRFVNQLLLKTARSSATSLRNKILMDEAREIYPDISRYAKGTSYWIDALEIRDEVSKIESLGFDSDIECNMIDSLVDMKFDDMEEAVVQGPRREYIQGRLDQGAQPELANLINRLSEELDEQTSNIAEAS